MKFIALFLALLQEKVFAVFLENSLFSTCSYNQGTIKELLVLQFDGERQNRKLLEVGHRQGSA